MITVTVYQNEHMDYTGFVCRGHAGYAAAGADIVCAAVSVLVVNTVNSVEKFTKTRTIVHDTDGEVSLRIDGESGTDAQLLLRSMVLGLQGVADAYGSRYMKLTFKEV